MSTRALISTPARTIRTASRALTITISAARPLSTKSKTKTDGQSTVEKVNEGDTYNIRESDTKDAIKSAEKGTGGTATAGSDDTGAVKKAKKDFPAAPDPAIGMQDERGGKGY